MVPSWRKVTSHRSARDETGVSSEKVCTSHSVAALDCDEMVVFARGSEVSDCKSDHGGSSPDGGGLGCAVHRR